MDTYRADLLAEEEDRPGRHINIGLGTSTGCITRLTRALHQIAATR